MTFPPQIPSFLKTKKGIAIVAVGSILIVAGIPSYYFYSQYQHAQLLLKNPSAAAKQEIEALVAKVGRLIELPQGEQPTIATISDVSKLSGQPFFAHAQNGDKVLVYTNTKKAILYRPSEDKLVEVASVNIGTVSQQASSSISSPSGSLTPSPTPSKPVSLRIALLNGTSVVGLTHTVEKDLKGKITNPFDVTVRGNAKNDYDKTLVIDVSGKNSAVVKQLAASLSGDAVGLPKGEDSQDVDIIIIIGKNYVTK